MPGVNAYIALQGTKNSTGQDWLIGIVGALILFGIFLIIVRITEE